MLAGRRIVSSNRYTLEALVRLAASAQHAGAEFANIAGQDVAHGRPSAVTELGVAGAVRHLKDILGGAIASIPSCPGEAMLAAMDLGGNAPVIVMADCDLEATVASCVSGAFWAAGRRRRASGRPHGGCAAPCDRPPRRLKTRGGAPPARWPS